MSSNYEKCGINIKKSYIFYNISRYIDYFGVTEVTYLLIMAIINALEDDLS